MQKNQLKPSMVFPLLAFMSLVMCLSLFYPLSVNAADVVVKEYTVDASNTEVDANQVLSSFLKVQDGEVEYDDVDVKIIGIGAEWYFSYDNIYRNTGRWEPFIGAVAQEKLSDSALPQAWRKVLADVSDTEGVYLDFHDGDHFPGTAAVRIVLPEKMQNTAVRLYDYIPAEGEQDARLIPLAAKMQIGDDGALTLTMTESHDYVVLTETAATPLGADLDAWCGDVFIQADDSFLATASWQVLTLCAFVLVLVVGAIVVGIVVFVKRLRRKKAENKGNTVNKHRQTNQKKQNKKKNTIEQRLNQLPPKSGKK